MSGPFQTPSDLPATIPDLGGNNVAQRGGYDIEDGQKETPNQSGIPLLPDTFVVPDAPAKNATVSMPDLTTSRTIKTNKD